jgi:hypothetical protein
VPAKPAQEQVAGKASLPAVAICNAYSSHSPLQAFAISQDGSQYTEVAHSLPFQACQDIDEFPEETGTISFVVERLQVARAAYNATRLGPGRGLEMVLHRYDVNSLKGKVSELIYKTNDAAAYYLNVVNAYAGSRLLELHVNRGSLEQTLPLDVDKTYRLDREQMMQLMLTDGMQHLRLSFQPRKSRTYTIITTGVDVGVRGEPENVGLVAHELGAWTSAEEMSDDAPGGAEQESSPHTPPVLFSEETPTTPAPRRLRRGVSWLSMKIGQYIPR